MSATMSVSFIGARSRLVSFMTSRVSGPEELVQLGFPEPGKPERHERIRGAVRSAGLEWPQSRITVLAQPGAVAKTAATDLAVAIAVLTEASEVPRGTASPLVFYAGLDRSTGELLPVPGVLPALSILTSPYTTAVVAPGDAAEAALVPGLTVVPAACLADVVTWLRSGQGSAAAASSEPAGRAVPTGGIR
jgi:magnesium chelatase family protein